MTEVRKYRTYVVTVTPSVVMHAGSWAGNEYTVEIYAKDRADAIKQARKARNDEEGRFAPRATFRAAVKEENCCAEGA